MSGDGLSEAAAAALAHAARLEGVAPELPERLEGALRLAGKGIVTLAQASGRPIVPFAVATSRRIELKNWDRTALNLPFSRMAIILGEPIRVPSDADDLALDEYRRQVEEGLNAVTQRAYAVVDGDKVDRRG